jgi:hypothetical protein
MMFSDADISERIASVEKQLESVRPPMTSTTERVPLLPSFAFEQDEQRRIAAEEWHEIQEDRYRLFQQTIDPVWSVDVRFAGHTSADSAVNDRPAAFVTGSVLNRPSSKHRPAPRSAAAALLDADEAVRLISAIDLPTATRLAAEIASDLHIDPAVRASLAQKLVNQARILSETASQQQATGGAGPLSPRWVHARVPSVASLNASNSVAALPMAASGQFWAQQLRASGSQGQADSARYLFHAPPAPEADMVQFNSDRTFDHAVAKSMRRLTGMLQVCFFVCDRFDCVEIL